MFKAFLVLVSLLLFVNWMIGCFVLLRDSQYFTYVILNLASAMNIWGIQLMWIDISKKKQAMEERK